MPVTREDIERSIAALVKQNRVTSLIYTLVIPALVGIETTFYKELVEINVLLFWAPFLIMVALAAAFAWITYDIKLAPELYVEMDDAIHQIDDLKKRTRFFSSLQEQALALGAIVRGQVKAKHNGEGHLNEAVNEICSLLVGNRADLFDFDASELWSFAVYIYHKENGQLYPVCRYKHEKHPSQSMGRVWRPGQGHVGIAWAQGEGKICPDVSVPGVADMFSPTSAKTSYDTNTYVSFVSEPIGPNGADAVPYGVLVATSNFAGRFDLASGLPLRHAASAIAALIYLAYDDDALKSLVETAKPAA
ncbi:hypothetical protein [Methylorubrum sp. POS3]|uniref:hypothetical protein n=1 Tax=Methylorubrum sp. POS3 TaxID=2998492 RepID=UPI003728BE16